MPRKKSGEFDQNKYVNDYISKNYKWVSLGFNQKVPEDVEIYEWLKQFKKTKAPYIKALIRKDMEESIKKEGCSDYDSSRTQGET